MSKDRDEEDEAEEEQTRGELAFTSDSTDVQTVSHGTFTAERAICVYALAINARVIEAFVDICNHQNINIRRTGTEMRDPPPPIQSIQ